MAVIDVDAHFEPVHNWLDEYPQLKAKLPEMFPDNDPRFRMGSPEMYAFFVSDDLLRAVPKERRTPIERIVTPAMQVMMDPARDITISFEGASQHRELTDVEPRLAWLDSQGIAMQNVISGDGYTYARVIDDPVLGMETLSAVNRWMAEAVAPANGRLAPVTSLRFEDLDWAVDELQRMRALGSRAFIVNTEPTGDLPPNHPEYDKLWAAAADLGMVALAHVGMSPARYHPSWANQEDPALIRVIATLQPAQQALVFLNAMVFGGVFERHPNLTVLFSEHGIDWFRPAVDRMEQLALPGVSPLLLGEYKLPLTPVEYVRRNVRISPLPVSHESPVRLLERWPEVAVFSSDYPHFEGSGDPAGHYAQLLADLPDTTRARFYSDNIAESYARMGDPLPLPVTAS